ncbi:MAG: GDCCVxC domain-containing (seleno)protein [Crocinitomicaceae bacterium]|nr:GDCCVxC domain-containing (seleno)protein [Crocinitomicaceae bacterium]
MKPSSFLLFFCLSIILIGCQFDEPVPTWSERIEESLETSPTSDITCPSCGHTETEELPTTQCLLLYDCKSCGETMKPEGNDCCVFCTHGTHECPSIQEQNQ